MIILNPNMKDHFDQKSNQTFIRSITKIVMVYRYTIKTKRSLENTPKECFSKIKN